MFITQIKIPDVLSNCLQMPNENRFLHVNALVVGESGLGAHIHRADQS